MPMPKPHEGEGHDDFMARCMTEMAGEYDDAGQRYAVCQSQWDGKTMDVNLKLIEAIRTRTTGEPFGYGITTADRYVREAIKGMQATAEHERLLTRAANTLAYADAGMVIEKRASKPNDWAEIANGMQVPPNTLMVFRHIVTTSREDRDKDVLITSGASLDPKAPLLWQHMHTMPIGKILAVVEQTDAELKVVSALLDLNAMTADIAKLIEADVLRFSHGFRPIEFKQREQDNSQSERSGVVSEANEYLGFEISKFEILEVSLVSVPSNVDAEVELWSRSKWQSDMMKAHAKVVADQRALTVAGITLPESQTEREEKDITVVVPQHKAAVKYENTPVSESGDWDGDAAVKHLRGWAGVDAKEPPDAAWTKYRRGFARVTGEGDAFGDYSFPHHDIEGDKLVVNKTACAAAIAICNGARGVKVKWESEEERKAVYSHLAAHYKAWDAEAPALKAYEDMADDERELIYGHSYSLVERHGPHVISGIYTTTLPNAMEELKAEQLVELTQWFGVKVGRVLSQRNLDALQEVVADLKELLELELPRKAAALIERCAARVQNVLKTAMADDESGKETQEIKDAMRLLLASANEPQLRKLRATIDVILETNAKDAMAAKYRRIVRR